MTLQQLEYILAVNQFRHFAKAAEYCRVTQPTLSAMIQKLEEMYFINERAYSRNINNICLELSKYINYENPPRIEDLNRKFNEYMKSISY